MKKRICSGYTSLILYELYLIHTNRKQTDCHYIDIYKLLNFFEKYILLSRLSFMQSMKYFLNAGEAAVC